MRPRGSVTTMPSWMALKMVSRNPFSFTTRSRCALASSGRTRPRREMSLSINPVFTTEERETAPVT